MSNQVEMLHVNSSNINSVGYDTDNQTVHVNFLNGSTYTYQGVPEHEFRNLLTAASVGSYLHRHYKNVYPYSRIG